MAFSNMAQATVEDRAAITNLMGEDIIIAEQVDMYANRISAKEADKEALQTEMKNL